MKTHPKPIQVITKSPLIWCEIGQTAGHASLLIGFHPKHGFINYNPGSQMSFQTASNVMNPDEKAGEPKTQMGGSIHFISVATFDKIFSGTAWGYYV